MLKHLHSVTGGRPRSKQRHFTRGGMCLCCAQTTKQQMFTGVQMAASLRLPAQFRQRPKIASGYQPFLAETTSCLLIFNPPDLRTTRYELKQRQRSKLQGHGRGTTVPFMACGMHVYTSHVFVSPQILTTNKQQPSNFITNRAISQLSGSSRYN